MRTATVMTMAVLALLVASCSPTSTTSGLGDDLSVGDDGWYGIRVDESMPKPDLVLSDTSGATFDLRARTAGQPTLLFFGYTSCPDICPVHLSVLARAMDEARIATDQVSVVFVSADPDRDQPEKLRDYLDSFDPGFIGLTGDIEEVRRAINSLGLPEPTYSEPDSEGDYSVGHPAAIIAFGRDGNAHHLYPFGTRQVQWVHDLPRITGSEGS